MTNLCITSRRRFKFCIKAFPFLFLWDGTLLKHMPDSNESIGAEEHLSDIDEPPLPLRRKRALHQIDANVQQGAMNDSTDSSLLSSPEQSVYEKRKRPRMRRDPCALQENRGIPASPSPVRRASKRVTRNKRMSVNSAMDNFRSSKLANGRLSVGHKRQC